MKKIPNGHEVIQLFEQFAPKHLAMEGDRIGLQIGTLNKPIHTVMITLDVLEEVVDEAIENKVDLIIAHHPPLYRPVKHIITDQTQGRIIAKCMKHDIAIYAAHTNLDIAEGGVNDWLSEALGLQEVEVLVPTYEEALKKLVVYVPDTHADAVREALGNAGAGHIGNYSHCTFNSRGIGTFLPQEGANPFIGEKGTLEKVEEVRIETIFPASLQKKVVTAMLKAHPYEEVAYDVYPLENKGRTFGLGRLGRLREEMTLAEFAEHVKKALDVPAVRVVGNLQDKVNKVAVVGGDGNKYISQAKFSGADVYVTGDVYYHVAHDAMMLGLNIVDPGHNVEKVMKQGVARFLEQQFAQQKFATTVYVSQVHTDPFTFL
ncbi:Nif3-like dinuclear metal center hexameric protein [Thermaerobacillus caldiproteolyticus]|uniref:GTP cyclohydrolase 1 type 2 homolog n=1 Tax=Thermaerobacillus caldiproteolyticus TaxID=247480 RepID=A0A7V9Z3R7_9BACL|nr:Nif3-like dinuclear metal center hexameric protein [Anoxybacillus caldiproteolyticus]MBA2873509.1 dinuclear metal center YbgI/SA1388 family protein [Anoxybacillus caldiproteolyticus]QPA30102.1 Nif3-like dinuclear metal center hexameric protein [Anoxybacillus caldiproteolyticus]